MDETTDKPLDTPITPTGKRMLNGRDEYAEDYRDDIIAIEHEAAAMADETTDKPLELLTESWHRASAKKHAT